MIYLDGKPILFSKAISGSSTHAFLDGDLVAYCGVKLATWRPLDLDPRICNRCKFSLRIRRSQIGEDGRRSWSRDEDPRR